MSKRLKELQAQKAALLNEAKAINAKADFGDEDQKAYDAKLAEITKINAALERAHQLDDQERAMIASGRMADISDDRSAVLEVSDDAIITGGEQAAAKDPKHGFRNFGEFCQAVRKGCAKTNAAIDERLLIGAATPSTFGGEGAGQDGGFLVPPEYSTDIFQFAFMEDSLLPFTDQVEIGSNSMVFPKDETVPWGTDGMRAYWQAEAAAATPTKPKLGLVTLRLHKLLALVPVTDELLADSAALASYIPSKVSQSIRWKTNEAILNGLGNGQPIGALNGGAALTVTKDTGQATGTLTTTNLTNMIARLPPGSFSRAIWLINNDVLGALFSLTLGNYPVWLPTANPAAGGIAFSPYGNLLGRPIIVSQHANTFSSLGDVQLHDLKYYQSIVKTGGGMQVDTSMHLYFDADATAFRVIFRMDGAPKITNQISPAKGANKLSPFLQLQAR